MTYKNCKDEQVEDVADAIVYLADRIAHAIRMLGNADAATPLGAIEAHGAAIIKASENIGDALGCIFQDASIYLVHGVGESERDPLNIKLVD